MVSVEFLSKWLCQVACGAPRPALQAGHIHLCTLVSLKQVKCPLPGHMLIFISCSSPLAFLGRGLPSQLLSWSLWVAWYIHLLSERKLSIPERISLPLRACQSFCHVRAGGQWTVCRNAANVALEADFRPPCHFIFFLWLILLEELGC